MTIKYIDMVSHPGGLVKLTAVVDGDKSIIAEQVRKSKEKLYELIIRPVRKKRSLDANAYYWTLIEKLAKVLEIKSEEMHQMMMRDYGTFKANEDGEIAIFSIEQDKDPRYITPYSRVVGYGEADGKPIVHYAALKGSHEMNSKEFSELLDGLIYECKEMGIETLSPEELKRMKFENNNSHSTENKKE